MQCCSTPSAQSDTCDSENTVVAHCPQCNAIGSTVGLETVKAIVVNLEQVQPTNYRFCKSPDCQVVYFAEDRTHHVVETDLRERVYQKHPDDGDVLICYCFQHTPNSIRFDMANGCADVADRITALTKAGRCACDIRNPQGSCCLGNVRKVVKSVLL